MILTVICTVNFVVNQSNITLLTANLNKANTRTRTPPLTTALESISEDNNNASIHVISHQWQQPVIFCPLCYFQPTQFHCSQRLDYMVQRNYHANRNESENALAQQNGAGCGIETVSLESKKEGASFNSLRGWDGKWVQDQEYARKHAYLDAVQLANFGVTGNMPNFTAETSLRLNSTLWKWVDSNSPVTEISLDGFCKVCEELDITRIFFVGDSLIRTFRRSVEELLGFTRAWMTLVTREYEHMVNQEFRIPCSQSANNLSHVTFKMQKVNQNSELMSFVGSGPPDFISSNTHRTALIFNNAGAHQKNLEEYRHGFEGHLSWIDSWGLDESKLIAFALDTIPGHPKCSPSTETFDKEGNDENGSRFELLSKDQTQPYATYSDYWNSTQNKLNQQLQLGNATSWTSYDFTHSDGTFEQFNAYAKSVLDMRQSDKLQVHWLNVFNSTILRKDAHLGFGGEI